MAVCHQHVRVGLNPELIGECALLLLQSIEETYGLFEVVAGERGEAFHQFLVGGVLEEDYYAGALAALADVFVGLWGELLEVGLAGVLLVVLGYPLDEREFLLGAGVGNSPVDLLNSCRIEPHNWEVLQFESLLELGMFCEVELGGLYEAFQFAGDALPFFVEGDALRALNLENKGTLAT